MEKKEKMLHHDKPYCFKEIEKIDKTDKMENEPPFLPEGRRFESCPRNQKKR